MPKPLIYAGVGSRRTPSEILSKMADFAQEAVLRGWKLRSGGADGADKAFETSAKLCGGEVEIFRPENTTVWARLQASAYHPAWNRCTEYAKLLHARNVQIVLGRSLNRSVRFVICWTERGRLVGGTAMAIRVATSNQIPVINLSVTPYERALKILNPVSFPGGTWQE